MKFATSVCLSVCPNRLNQSIDASFAVLVRYNQLFPSSALCFISFFSLEMRGKMAILLEFRVDPNFSFYSASTINGLLGRIELK